VTDGVLWDADGREWTTKPTRWATPKQAAGFVGRDAPVGLVEAGGRPVVWMSGSEAQRWWAHARLHFDVPGSVDAEPDAENRTWSAHIWQRGADRMLIFETNS
jgi:hypothetical protein